MISTRVTCGGGGDPLRLIEKKLKIFASFVVAADDSDIKHEEVSQDEATTPEVEGEAEKEEIAEEKSEEEPVAVEEEVPSSPAADSTPTELPPYQQLDDLPEETPEEEALPEAQDEEEPPSVSAEEEEEHGLPDPTATGQEEGQEEAGLPAKESAFEETLHHYVDASKDFVSVLAEVFLTV